VPANLTLADVIAELRHLREALTAPPSELLDREAFAAMLAIGESTFDRLRATGAVGPQPIRLSGLKWSRDEVTAWLRHRDQAGELHDAKTWPAIWQAIQKRAGITGR